jgi:hypothetical protein
MRLHEKECLKFPNRKLYRNVCEYGWKHFDKKIIREYRDMDPYELRKRESYYIHLVGTLNSQKPKPYIYKDEYTKSQLEKIIFSI